MKGKERKREINEQKKNLRLVVPQQRLAITEQGNFADKGAWCFLIIYLFIVFYRFFIYIISLL